MAGRIILGIFNPALDSNGDVAAGTTLTFYENLTTTLQSIYDDPDLLTPLDNPLECDAAGRFPEIWGPNGSVYSVKVEVPGESAITYDNIALTADPNPADQYLFPSRWKPDAPANAEVLIKWNVPVACTLAADLNDGVFPSLVTVDTNPTATWTLSITKNGGNIGSLSISTGGVVTVTFNNEVSFAAGDVFAVTNQATADATGAGLAMTFVFRVA